MAVQNFNKCDVKWRPRKHNWKLVSFKSGRLIYTYFSRQFDILHLESIQSKNWIYKLKIYIIIVAFLKIVVTTEIQLP